MSHLDTHKRSGHALASGTSPYVLEPSLKGAQVITGWGEGPANIANNSAQSVDRGLHRSLLVLIDRSVCQRKLRVGKEVLAPRVKVFDSSREMARYRMLCVRGCENGVSEPWISAPTRASSMPCYLLRRLDISGRAFSDADRAHKEVGS